MLSAKKVKIHGMQSRRWTTKDKLTQYKGLLNLYTRDRKILEFDTNVTRKKQLKELKTLQKDVMQYREDLDNAIRGDRQQLRNCLQEHRSLQLAYQDLHPHKVIDHIHQDNFRRRKELDREKYQMKQKSQKLIDLKLELAELEDRLREEAMFGSIPEEQQAQIITGQVQDAILKKEAAITVRNTYRSILNIMKKDSVYFDAVMDTLKQDAIAQGKCMFRTTELGQLATEYLDDRQDEFMALEKTIKTDMKEREAEFEEIQKTVDSLSKRLKTLIRRDSDITMCGPKRKKLRVTESMADIQNEISGLEELLNKLKSTLLVTSFDCIFPCFEQQKLQTEKLKIFGKKLMEMRDIAYKKFLHARRKYSIAFFTMADTTMLYKTKKRETLSNIEEQIVRKEHYVHTIAKRGEIIVQIRKSMQFIFHVCKHVSEPIESKKFTLSIDSEPSKIEEIDSDGEILINKIYKKLQILIASAPHHLREEQVDQANLKYTEFVHKYTRIINPLHKQEYECLVEVQIDDSKVPTREYIKQKSKEIVCENTRAAMEEFIVLPQKSHAKKKWS